MTGVVLLSVWRVRRELPLINASLAWCDALYAAWDTALVDSKEVTW